MEAQNAELRDDPGSGRRNCRCSPRPIDGDSAQSTPGWALGMVSWVAAGPNGLIYLLQRGEKADPVIVVDRTGKIVRSWGKGCTRRRTRSASTRKATSGPPMRPARWSTSFRRRARSCSRSKWADSPRRAEQLLQHHGHCVRAEWQHLHCGRLSQRAHPRIHADGKKVREWGSAGTGPGQFRLPHSIQIDEPAMVYVADRENGRIQRFDLEGKYLGEWSRTARRSA